MHVHDSASNYAGSQAIRPMTKQPFTTRIDADVLALARQLADAERRSITALIEVALLEYAERRGISVPEKSQEVADPKRGK
jgi:hypothetical protein